MNRKDKVLRRLNRHKRIRKNVVGTDERPRLVIYKSANHIYAQLVIDPPVGSAKVLTGASTLSPEIRDEVKDVKGKTERAKLVGKLIAERAKKLGITKVSFDRAGYKYIGRVKSLADAARESGLEF